MIVISLRNGREVGVKLARLLKARHCELTVHEFPDGEFKIRFPASLKGRKVVLVQSASIKPNDYLVELLIAISTAKELGAKRVVVVMPYLCYSRQDKRFKAGEGMSSFIVAKMIKQAGASEVYTVAAHLHRIRKLSELFKLPGRDVIPFQELAKWIKVKIGIRNLILCGPDWESRNVVEPVAGILGVPCVYFEKQRYGNRDIRQKLKGDLVVKGKRVVILDDVISTGVTIQGAAVQLKKLGASYVHVGAVHLMGLEGAKRSLEFASSFFVSDSVPSKYSKYTCANALARAVKLH